MARMKNMNPFRLLGGLSTGIVHLLSRLRVGTRLAAGFSVLLVMTLIAVVVGWLQLRDMQVDFREVTVNTLPAILLVGDMRSNAEEIRRQQLRLITAADGLARKRIVSSVVDTRGLTKTLYETYGKDMLKDDQDRGLWKALGEKFDAYEQLSVKIEAQALTEVDETDPANTTAMQQQLQLAVDGEAFSAFGAVSTQLEEVKALNLQRSRDAEARGNKTFERGQIILAGTAAFALLLGLILAWALTRSVVVPLGAAVEAIRRMAEGILDRRINVQGRDELSAMLRALSKMQESWQDVVQEIRTSSSFVANGSSEIAAGNRDLSNRTEEQAASLEETAASIEDLTTTVKQSAETAHQVDQLAVAASKAADKGVEVVSQVVHTMQGIQKSSDKISEIIGVIDSIAFQTNILALNAAVEAARAGEQGRGFAVVATEVRNLAQHSANAAKEIKVLITASANTVRDGSRLVGEAGQNMQDVRSQVREVTALVTHILSASTQQRTGIVQINEAMEQLDRTTQQNAALVEQASAASESLQQQANRLMEVMSVFQIETELNESFDEI